MQQTQVAIIGSGPAGFTAGIYAARAALAPIQITGSKSGGQLMWTTDVENYPGFPNGMDGPQLMMDMRAQAEKFGTTMLDSQVTAVDFSARPFKLWTNYPEGVTLEEYERAQSPRLDEIISQIKATPPAVEAETVIITTGAESIMLGVPGEMEFLGKGVSTCAVCDAAFYKDKVTYVSGGGDSAMEDTLALIKFAKEVTVIHRRDTFKASKIMQERVLSNPKVKVLWNSTITEVKGEDKVTKIMVKTTSSTGEQNQELPADGVFIAIGHKPMSALFESQLERDSHGYLVTRVSHTQAGVAKAQAALDDSSLVAFPTMTNIAGIFAAGDVVDIRYKQAITAAAQGCMAAIDAERFLESR